MNYGATGTRGDLFAVSSTGTIIPVTTTAGPSTTGVVIPSAGTYYFPFGSELGGVPLETAENALSLRWTAALAGTATIEVTNFPGSLSGADSGGPDVSEYINDGISWQLFNPTLSTTTYAVASGTGNSVTAYTLTLGGTNAGGAAFNLPANGWRRAHLKLVASAGGTIRANVHGKVGR